MNKVKLEVKCVCCHEVLNVITINEEDKKDYIPYATEAICKSCQEDLRKLSDE